MQRRITRRQQQAALVAMTALLLLGYLCQIVAVDQWLSPIKASNAEAGVQQCHGSLANCAGTVDIGSSLHATLTPPVAPEPRGGTLDVAIEAPLDISPSIINPPPQA